MPFNARLMEKTALIVYVGFVVLLALSAFGFCAPANAATILSPEEYTEQLRAQNPNPVILSVDVIAIEDVPLTSVRRTMESINPEVTHVVVARAAICNRGGTVYMLYVTPIMADGNISTRGLALPVDFVPGECVQQSVS